MLPDRRPLPDGTVEGRPSGLPQIGIPWETIFAALSDGVVIHDADGRLTWANESAIAACGLNPIGTTAAEAAASLAARNPYSH